MATRTIEGLIMPNEGFFNGNVQLEEDLRRSCRDCPQTCADLVYGKETTPILHGLKRQSLGQVLTARRKDSLN